MAVTMTSMKASSELLYEEHVLNNSKEYEFQIQRKIEAVRKQYCQSLEANRLILPTSYISELQQKLSTTTITISVLPKKKDLRRSDEELYEEVDLKDLLLHDK